jgi:sugar diacid utilization regulator
MDKPKKGDRITDTDAEVIMAMSRNDMSIQRAADELNYTRNAVGYHVRKIRRVTGLNPKGFFDLQELLKMVGGSNG